MLNKIREFNYSEARYYILKEFDTQGPVGRILTTIVPQLSLIMVRVCEQIDKLHAWNPGDPEDDLLISRDTIDAFIDVQNNLPSLILIEDTLPWNDFMSAWCAVINEYCSTYGAFAEYKLQQNNQDPFATMLVKSAEDIHNTMEPIMKLAYLGAGYTELLQASASIVKELKSWRQSRPASLRLSQTYLSALGLVPPETKRTPGNNNPPSPPPPPIDGCGPQEDCGNNPPPPPPPPPIN